MHFGDYTFIFLLALVLLGPKKMPELGRQLGKLLAEFRRASNEFKFQIQEELRVMEEEERKKKLAESQALAAASNLAMSEAGVTGRSDDGPTILPPATGDPVSAARPFAVPAGSPAVAEPLPAPDVSVPAPRVPDLPATAEAPAALPEPLNVAAGPPAAESISHA